MSLYILFKKEKSIGIFLSFYLFFSIFCFLVAPFPVYNINKLKTILYASLSWSLFGWGYFYKNAKINKLNAYEVLYKNPSYIVISLSAFIVVVTLARLISLGYSINIKSILISMSDLGGSYFLKWGIMKDWQERKNLFVQFYNISSFVHLLLIPFAFLYWKRIKKIAKVFFIVALLIRLLPGIITGTMIDVFVVFVELGMCMFILISKEQLTKNVKKAFYISIIILIVIFIIFGIKAMLNRADYLGWAPWQGLQRWYYNPNNILAGIIGERIGFGLNSLIWYLGHGYEGLGQCLELPFVWTYGIGHSRALMEYADQYLGWDWVWDRHYLWRNYKITGRDPLRYWPTALVWMASDVTFIGVLFILFFIGKLTRRFWVQSMIVNDPILIAIFNRIVLLILFLPMNLQIFQGRVMWWGTIGLVIVWYVHKKIRKIRYIC